MENERTCITCGGKFEVESEESLQVVCSKECGRLESEGRTKTEYSGGK